MFERWDETELDLRVEATLALDAGLVPEPTLVAFGDAEPVAVVGLRPFDHEGVLQALVEVLALLLPLGARRVALSLPGQLRDADGETDDDPGALMVLATAEETGQGTARLAGRVLPLAHDGDCWQWRDDAAIGLDAEAWEVTRALGVLLCDRPTREIDAHELQAQLGRCLLLGHAVALAESAADRLEPGRSLAGPLRFGRLSE